MRIQNRSLEIGNVDVIVESQSQQQELLKTGALQNATLTSANFSIIATDEKGTVQLFNPGAERMLGYSASEVVGKISPSDIHDPLELAAHAQALSTELATSIAPGFEALAFKASRSIEDVYESTFVRKQAEIELQNAMAIAEKANLAKSDFLSSMSHELRTPLSAVLGFAQLMESGSPPPSASQQRSIGQILKAGWYLLDLINEVLDLALIESGKLSLSMEPVSLAEVMQECRNMIEPQAAKNNISVSFPSFDTPYFVSVDRTRLKQAVINLLSNAIKYNRVGGAVDVSCGVITPGRIRICVEDGGDGLCQEKIAQLFQPFNRLGQETAGKEGTGIGLVTAKRLIELMGGTIGVESTVGKGSVFWVEVRQTDGRQYLEDAVEPIKINPVAAGNGVPLRTVLYVEDAPANLMLVESLVARRPDIAFLSATDGGQGVEIARCSQPDMILMDINLPGISGIQALKILREDAATAHIPVVALSANAIPRDIKKGLEAGFVRYLTKPIKIDEFMETLDATLNLVKTESALEVAAVTRSKEA